MIKIIFQGDVQAVGFRAFIKREAIKKNLCGYVKNLDSGDVEAVFSDEKKAKEIIEKAKQYSEINDIKIEKIKHTDLRGFEIRY